MKPLNLKQENRSLSIRLRSLPKKEVILNCHNFWESDDPDFGEDETDDASYYLSIEDIDKLISKLKEAKEFLKSHF